MKFLILLFLILVSFEIKGQNKDINAVDSLRYKRLEQLKFNYDSVQNKLDSLIQLIDSVTIRSDSIYKLIYEGPKITSFEEYRFENWLRDFGLSSLSFKDTIVEESFELWSYKRTSDKLEKEYFRIASPDSSYILLTNYNRNNVPQSGFLDFKFLDVKTKFVYNGIIALEERDFDILDYFWFNNETFYIISKDKHGLFRLMKIIIKINKIWTYKT